MRESKGENQKGGNGKCRLFVFVHTAQFTPNALISHGLPQHRETKVIYVGKKRKRTGAGSSMTVFSVCCRFAFKAEEREVLVMYCGFFTPGCLLANDYFTVYMCPISFKSSGLCLAFPSPVLD